MREPGNDVTTSPGNVVQGRQARKRPDLLRCRHGQVNHSAFTPAHLRGNRRPEPRPGSRGCNDNINIPRGCDAGKRLDPVPSIQPGERYHDRIFKSLLSPPRGTFPPRTAKSTPLHLHETGQTTGKKTGAEIHILHWGVEGGNP